MSDCATKSSSSYALEDIAVIIATLVSGLTVHRKLDQLELVAAQKAGD